MNKPWALLITALLLPAAVLRADPATEAMARREQPRGALAWFKQGVALAERGEYRAALNRYHRARQLAPRWALPHLEITVAHLMTDNDRERIGRSLAKAVELGSEIPRAHYLYGVYLHEQGERERARAEFIRALQLRPSLLDARYRLATLYVEAGRQAAGIEQYELVLQQQPSHIGARRNLALLYERCGQIEQAEQQLRAVVRLDPDNPWQLTRLARFYERNGFAAKARQTRRRAERIEPTGRRRKLRPLLKSRD